MKRRNAIVAMGVLILGAAAGADRAAAQAPSPRQLVETAYDQERVPTMRVELGVVCR